MNTESNLHIRTEIVFDESPLSFRRKISYVRYEVWDGDEFLVWHLRKRTAVQHVKGLPVLSEGHTQGVGYRYHLWVGAECCANFTTRAEAEARLAALQPEQRRAA